FRGFLGLTGYYRRFVQAYAHIAAPLTDLLQHKQIQWNDGTEEAFQSLKTAMTTLSVLALLDFTLIFDVTTDASVMQTPKQHKWAVKLLGMNLRFTKENRVADALSRIENPQVFVFLILTFPWMQELRDYYLHNSEGKKLLERFSSQPTTLP
nr:retrotransposon-related protein [Tanacetum cinerariifolium]